MQPTYIVCNSVPLIDCNQKSIHLYYSGLHFLLSYLFVLLNEMNLDQLKMSSLLHMETKLRLIKHNVEQKNLNVPLTTKPVQFSWNSDKPKDNN